MNTLTADYSSGSDTAYKSDGMCVRTLNARIVGCDTVDCDPTDIYRVSEYSAPAPEHVAPGDSISYAAVRPTFGHETLAQGHNLLIMINAASWGEYDNSSTYHRSNYRVLVENYGQWLVTVDNGNDRDGRCLALVIGSVVPAELLSIVNGLRDYPVIDESDVSDLEMELAEEAWDAYLRTDVPSDMVSAGADQDIVDALSDGALRQAFYQLAYETGDYPHAESAVSVIFPGYDTTIAAMVHATRRAAGALESGEIDVAFLAVINGKPWPAEIDGQTSL